MLPRSIAGRLFLAAMITVLTSLAAALAVLGLAGTQVRPDPLAAVVVAVIAGSLVAYVAAFALVRNLFVSALRRMSADSAADLERIQRLERVRRDFVANVSHELRTPVASLKAMVETLEGGALDDQAAARDFIARMHREIDGLAQLVSELLTLSRVESGEDAPRLEEARPADLVDRAVERLSPLADRAGVALTQRVTVEHAVVRADPEKIGQVLANLIHNAIKFTPEGGRVEVWAAREPRAVRFGVTDTGAGLAPAELERVFERFYKGEGSRSGAGTGLGLAIAKHIVQAHGGTIAAQSAGPGLGSTFTFTLQVVR